jgi:CheY-like chemotaxis protein
LASGFQAWVSKPLDPAELLATVAQLAAASATAPRLVPGHEKAD